MITLIQISAWGGLVLLLMGCCLAIGALLILPFLDSTRTGDATPDVETSADQPTWLNHAGMGFSLLAWPIYAVVTWRAVFTEINTLFSNAGFGYVYIMLGMPAFFLTWLSLLVYASIRSVRSEWLFGALIAAALIGFGYANINGRMFT